MYSVRSGLVSALLVLLLAYLFTGCATVKKGIHKIGGSAAAGAGAGAIGGVIIAKNNNVSPVVGAIIGAAVGGVAGHIVGSYMDGPADELKSESIDGVNIEIKTNKDTGEVIGILLTFDGDSMFAVNSDQVNPALNPAIAKVSAILAKYEKTEVQLGGYTDSWGSKDYNLSLSERRAATVSQLLESMNVDISDATGYGEEYNIAPNDTPAGRARNRRVEIAVYASKELIAEAQAAVNQG